MLLENTLFLEQFSQTRFWNNWHLNVFSFFFISKKMFLKTVPKHNL